MEASVFTYFLAIGAGLTTGIGLVAVPIVWLLQKIKRGGTKKNVY